MKILSNLMCIIGLMLWINTICADELPDGLKSQPELKLQVELLAALKSFGKQHSLNEGDVKKLMVDLVTTDSELRREAGRIIFDGKNVILLNKGGMVPLGRGIYYLPESTRNALKVSGRDWVGKESSQREVVFTDGEFIGESLDGMDTSKVLIVIFTAAEVRVINLYSYTGYLFPRSPRRAQ